MSKPLIYVYKVVRPSATKITEIVNGKNLKRLNQTKIDGKIKETFSVLLSQKTGKLATGLDVHVPNPYRGKTGSIVNESFKFLERETQETALLQDLKELEYNLPKGYLSNEPANIHNKKHLENPSFYQTFRWKLNDGLTVFNPNNMNDDLAVIAMETSVRFANSKKELDAGKFPYALYYIAQGDETEEVKFTKKQMVDQAKAHLTMGEVQDTVTQSKFVKLLLPEIGKGVLTPMQTYNTLSENIDSNTRDKTGKLFIDKYNELITLLKSADGRSKFEAMVILQDAYNLFLINEKQGTYTWVAKDLRIGQTKEEAIRFILSPDKQDYVDELKEQIMAKKQQRELV